MPIFPLENPNSGESPRGYTVSRAKCLLSVSTTWCGLRRSSLQLELEILTIMMKKKSINK